MTTFTISLINGWIAYNLYYPRKNKKNIVLNALSWSFGLIVGEALPHFIVIEALIILIFVAADAINGFWASLGLIIIIVSWVAMANHYVKGFRAKETVENALKKALLYE